MATAVHGGDHFIYPDCSRICELHGNAKSRAGGICGCGPLHALSQKPKRILPPMGPAGVPLKTWSCYKEAIFIAGVEHAERREAFDLAGVVDPTQYADPIIGWTPSKRKGRVAMHIISKSIIFFCASRNA